MAVNLDKPQRWKSDVEEERLRLQQKLDAEKIQEERNRLGQFATPTELSIEILNYAKNLIPSSEKIRFLDPAFGTGSFYSALIRSFPRSRIECAFGYEIDILVKGKNFQNNNND